MWYSVCMDRREFLAAISAGAVVTAGGLWLPGQKLISIPSKRAFFWQQTPMWCIDYGRAPAFGVLAGVDNSDAIRIIDEIQLSRAEASFHRDYFL